MFSSNIYFGSKMCDKYTSPLPNLGGGKKQTKPPENQQGTKVCKLWSLRAFQEP